MLRSETLFGKRDNPPSGTPQQPGSPLGSSLGGNAAPNIPKPASPAGAPNLPTANAGGANEGGSKLIVGPNIKLKGVEITDCDTLVVEGRVEATMDSRVIQIAENGAFKGSAEIDIAEIRGDFDGELTVRERLVIYSTGKVSGKIRYGKVVIEEGGQLTGEVQAGGAQAPKMGASKPQASM